MRRTFLCLFESGKEAIAACVLEILEHEQRIGLGILGQVEVKAVLIALQANLDECCAIGDPGIHESSTGGIAEAHGLGFPLGVAAPIGGVVGNVDVVEGVGGVANLENGGVVSVKILTVVLKPDAGQGIELGGAVIGKVDIGGAGIQPHIGVDVIKGIAIVIGPNDFVEGNEAASLHIIDRNAVLAVAAAIGTKLFVENIQVKTGICPRAVAGKVVSSSTDNRTRLRIFFIVDTSISNCIRCLLIRIIRQEHENSKYIISFDLKIIKKCILPLKGV